MSFASRIKYYNFFFVKILTPQTVIVSADESSNYQALYFSSFAITFGSPVLHPAWLGSSRAGLPSLPSMFEYH